MEQLKETYDLLEMLNNYSDTFEHIDDDVNDRVLKFARKLARKNKVKFSDYDLDYNINLEIVLTKREKGEIK